MVSGAHVGMKRTHGKQKGDSALEMIEQATHLLRAAPAATLASYYVGSIPFVLGLLYFWADMSLSPFAHAHRAEAALAMAVLFLWMKFFHAVFARRLRARRSGEAMPRWNLKQCGAVLLGQSIVQPTGLFLIPLSAVPALPLGWVYAFYQNCSVMADPDSPVPLTRRAYKQAMVWPSQNHFLLAIFFIFAVIVFLNWTAVSLSLPHLAKTLFGIETVFSRSPWSMLNPTFFTAMAGLTYLSVDPIIKAAYVLRCFHGESRQSGEDLKAELRLHSRAALPAAAVIMIAAMFCAGTSRAGESVAPRPAAPVQPAASPADLDHAIERVIHDRKYTWRMPREQVAEEDSRGGMISQFVEKVGELARNAARAVFRWVGKLWRQLFGIRPERGGGSGYGWILSQQLLLYGLVLVAVGALLFLGYRVWRGRQQVTSVASEPIQTAPDLSSEDVGPEQLPVDGWARLAQELLEQGDLRLALRAFYLSSLAYLADRNLISIARFKSNRDYQRELQRRAHALPDVGPLFGENVTIFERIWYGMHEVDRELVLRFAANVRTLRVAGGES